MAGSEYIDVRLSEYEAEQTHAALRRMLDDPRSRFFIHEVWIRAALNRAAGHIERAIENGDRISGSGGQR